MKLTYKKQMALAILIVILGNILTETFDHWLYRSAGFAVCGLLWIINPALPDTQAQTSKAIRWVRIAGVILILIGVFTRVDIS